MTSEYNLGLRLRRARENKRLTQEQAGRYAGVSGGSISGYENNASEPPVDVMRRLASLYGVTVDYLFGLDNRKVLILEGITSEQEQEIDKIVNIIQNMIKN